MVEGLRGERRAGATVLFRSHYTGGDARESRDLVQEIIYALPGIRLTDKDRSYCNDTDENPTPKIWSVRSRF